MGAASATAPIPDLVVCNNSVVGTAQWQHHPSLRLPPAPRWCR